MIYQHFIYLQSIYCIDIAVGPFSANIPTLSIDENAKPERDFVLRVDAQEHVPKPSRDLPTCSRDNAARGAKALKLETTPS